MDGSFVLVSGVSVQRNLLGVSPTAPLEHDTGCTRASILTVQLFPNTIYNRLSDTAGDFTNNRIGSFKFTSFSYFYKRELLVYKNLPFVCFVCEMFSVIICNTVI